MPTVMKIGSIKIYVYADDHNPPHVHVLHADCSAVIEIETGTVVKHRGFKASELKILVRTISANKEALLAAWESLNEDE